MSATACFCSGTGWDGKTKTTFRNSTSLVRYDGEPHRTQWLTQIPIRVVVNSVFVILLSFGIVGVVLYFLNRLERNRKLNLPGIPSIPSPKSWDFRGTLTEANAKVTGRSLDSTPEIPIVAANY